MVAVHTGPDGVDDGYVHYSVKWDEVRYGHAPRSGRRHRGDRRVDRGRGRAPGSTSATSTWCARWTATGAARRRCCPARRRRSPGLPGAPHVGRAVAAAGSTSMPPSARERRGRRRRHHRRATTCSPRTPACGGSIRRAARHQADPADASTWPPTWRRWQAVYLGGTRWALIADVDFVEERTPGALASADALFATLRTPFCGNFF